MAGFGRGRFGSSAFGGSEGSEIAEQVSIQESVSAELGVTLADVVGVTEGLSVGEGVALDETVSVFGLALAGAFSVNNIGGYVVRVTFPTQMHYDGLGDTGHFQLEPVVSGTHAPGAPVAIVGLQPLVDVIQAGNDGAVVPARLGPGSFDFSDGTSTQFRCSGVFDPTHVGDFLHLKSGQNVGIYQIVNVVEGPQGETLAVVDRPMVLNDGSSVPRTLVVDSSDELSDLEDAVSVPVDLQLVEIAGSRYTFRVKHPLISSGHPILAASGLIRRARPASTAPILNGVSGDVESGIVPQAAFTFSTARVMDYRTVRFDVSIPPLLRGASLAEIVDRFTVSALVDVEGNSGLLSIGGAQEPSDLDDGTASVDLQLIGISFGVVYTFRAKHPNLSEANPIRAVYRLARLARTGSAEPILRDAPYEQPADPEQPDEPEGPFVAEKLFNLVDVQMIDYRTFVVFDPSGPILRGSTLNAIVDRFSAVVQLMPSVEWEHTTGVQALDLRTSKLTNGRGYLFRGQQLFEKWPKVPTALQGDFVSQGVPQPRVVAAACRPEGQVTVTYDDVMTQDPENLQSRQDYSIQGSSVATVQRVHAVDERTVVLVTQGLGEGSHTVVVSTHSPKDIAGNPIDPDFNEAVFTATTPLTARSIFADRGPLVKPPLTLQDGSGASFASIQTIRLPGAVLTLADAGKRIRLSGSQSNDGVYDVLGVVAADQARVRARFRLPDVNSGAVDWELFDARTGQIADDPSDVAVRVNGLPVTPVAVVGLKGQVVLPPDALGEVQLDYSWIQNPRVEIRRLNSPEFRFNGWNRDHGGANASGRHYRYNNVLVTPGRYDADDMGAELEQPQLREVKYRAYERAYSAVLNDPTALLFNTPSHRIAFPPTRRLLEEEVVFYEASSLPESAAAPWLRKGTGGSAFAAAGSLVVVDNSAGTFPTGSPLFWTRAVDLSFDHVFTIAWRVALDTVTATEGVWTGIAAGYANDRVVFVVGYLKDGSNRQIAFLKRGGGNAAASGQAWGGGLDANGGSTGLPATFNWSVPHSYRLFTDRDGVTRLFIDGSVVETLRITADEAPFLQELNAPFGEVQGVFFGSLSGPAVTTSTWDFYRYISQPVNAYQTIASSFVSYEARALPELDPSPWTPVGFHGTAAIVKLDVDGVPDYLLLDSTSAATNATTTAAGLVGGDFRGYVKLEPLLTAASQVVVDAEVQLLTHTHGIDPDGLMIAVDDGTRLMQLAFLASESAPRLSYGGRSLPEDFAPYAWSAMGGQGAAMVGRLLRISDASVSDGKVFYINDPALAGTPERVIGVGNDYILEARLQVVSFAPDGAGFAGAFAQAFDGVRAVGFELVEIAGVRHVALHSDGQDLPGGVRVEFDWFDGQAHTYRLRKSTGGNLVTLFIDGELALNAPYTDFDTPAPDVVGMVSFGSATPASDAARSVVDWSYCNAWRVLAFEGRYVGLWKGYDPGALTGYHLPLKVQGRAASAVGNVLEDPLANFSAANVQAGDALIVDNGPNKGTYGVVAVTGSTTLTITASWPVQPTTLDYRIARETDWSDNHGYRLARDSTGVVTVFLDSSPLFSVDYDSVNLPPSAAGIVRSLSGGLPGVAFGSFSAAHLEQSRWGFLRYGIARGGSDLSIVPPHQVLNQWNVMESPERLMTLIPHSFTSYKSSSTGATPQTDPDFLSESSPAYTRLNEGTPPVPATQSFERRRPFVTADTVGSAGAPQDLLQDPGTFTFDDGTTRYTFTVPSDVLYTSLQLVEAAVGEPSLLAPMSDEPGPFLGGVEYQKEVCSSFSGDELATPSVSGGDSGIAVPAAGVAPWVMVSDNDRFVDAFQYWERPGTLSYITRVQGVGADTRTALYFDTPLLTSPSLQTTATFSLRMVSLLGTRLPDGDQRVRFGISAPGLTVGIGFVTYPLGERFMEVFDINDGRVMGRATFDYLDGQTQTFRIVRDPTAGVIEVSLDGR